MEVIEHGNNQRVKIRFIIVRSLWYGWTAERNLIEF